MNTFFATARRGVMVAGAALALVGSVGAHAADVYWSVGVQAPGVVMGVGAPPPVLVAPAAAWGYGPPQAYYGPPTVVYGPAYRAGWDHHRHRKHWKHERHDHDHRSLRGWDGHHDR